MQIYFLVLFINATFSIDQTSYFMSLIAPNQAEINQRLYPKAPSQEEIDLFFNENKIKPRHYEKFIGMRIGTFADIKNGNRSLQIKYWHLIFKKLVPKYGVLSNFKRPAFKSQSKSHHNRKVVYKVNQSTEIMDKLNTLNEK